jgi:hypothetical protein
LFFLVHDDRAGFGTCVETCSATCAAFAGVNHPLIAQFIEGALKIGFQDGRLAHFDASLTSFAKMGNDFDPWSSGY